MTLYCQDFHEFYKESDAMILLGDKVKITGIEAEDQGFMNELINDPDIEHMTAG